MERISKTPKSFLLQVEPARDQSHATQRVNFNGTKDQKAD